jgi:hypothetical protein
MTELICHDILVIIFDCLPLKNLIKLELVCKNFKNIIRSHKWNIQIRLYDMNKIKFVINNYNFVNYDLSYSFIDDDIVKKLGHCHTLDLSWCFLLTKKSIKYIDNCKKIKLDYCPNINPICLIPGHELNQLAEFYMHAVRSNNLSVVKHIEKSINDYIMRDFLYENFIINLHNCKVISLAMKCNNFRMFKHIEEYMDYRYKFKKTYISLNSNYFKYNLLIDVVENGNLEIFKKLSLIGYDINANYDNCLKTAIISGHYDIVKYLIDFGDKKNKSIHFDFYKLAITHKHHEIAKLLSSKPFHGIKVMPYKIQFPNGKMSFKII